MALAIYREARGEQEIAQIGVGWTLKNRAQRPSWWGKTIDGCAYKAWQYSSLTDPHDRQLTVWGIAGIPAWETAWRIAGSILDGTYDHPLPGADSYHDISVPTPDAMATGRFCGQIGRLKFWDVDHDFEAAAIVAAAPAHLSREFLSNLNDFLAPRA
jgi:spore germination cell wall hydrolase CwlJ-like protein